MFSPRGRCGGRIMLAPTTRQAAAPVFPPHGYDRKGRAEYDAMQVYSNMNVEIRKDPDTVSCACMACGCMPCVGRVAAEPPGVQQPPHLPPCTRRVWLCTVPRRRAPSTCLPARLPPVVRRPCPQVFVPGHWWYGDSTPFTPLPEAFIVGASLAMKPGGRLSVGVVTSQYPHFIPNAPSNATDL